MSIDDNQSIAGVTGRTGYLFRSGSIMFSDIFDGAPQFYPGSTIIVQELLTISTLIVEDKYVSADLRWFNPKRRLGSYQVGNISSVFTSGLCDEDEGYLDYETQVIRRYSSYTITANPDVLIGQHEQVSLDNCNFYLQPEVYLFPGNPSPVAGFRLYEQNPALLGSTTITRAPLADTEFFPQLAGVGIFLYPGVEGVNLNYKCRIINDIYTDYNPAPVPTCVFLQPTCDAEFAAFLAIPGNNAFDNQATCELALNQPCCSAQFVCNGGGTRTYYTFCSE